MDKNFELIKRFFETLKCSQCDNFFTKESITPIRMEENNVVVKIICSLCGKDMGLAILGLNREGFGMPDEQITCEDIVEAHQFFNGLGDDWMKYLPESE